MPQPADYRPEAALSSNHPATTKPTSRTANRTSTMPSAAMVRPDPPRGRPPERGTPQPHPRRLPSSFQAALQLGKLLHPRNGPRVRLFQGRQVTAPLRHQGQSCPGATLAMRLRPDRPDRGDRIRTTARGLLVQGRGFLAGEATSTRTPMGTAMSGRHPGDMDEPLWTAKEVAEFLNVSRDSLGHGPGQGASPTSVLATGDCASARPPSAAGSRRRSSSHGPQTSPKPGGSRPT
jgi:hypothetical protein